MIILKTKRLIAKLPNQESLSNRYKLLSDPEVTRFIGSGKTSTESEVKEFLQKNIEHYQKYGFCLFDIFLGNTGEFIGDAGLIYEGLNPENKNVEVGYRLLKEHWGRGYATELAECFINWGFANCKLDKIVAYCDSNNAGSSNVMVKCGMKYKGKHLYAGKNECDIYEIHKVGKE